MNWVHQFYTRQWEMMGTRPPAPQGRRLDLLAFHAKAPPSRLVELGAGGGDFAVAAARLGHEVVAIEVVPKRAEVARDRTTNLPVRIVEADFYAADIGTGFDTVCYWDGFGIGSDADQRRLLARIASWITPRGAALVEVYTPWFWAASAGREMRTASFTRRYDFDPAGSRLLDTWWHNHAPEDAVTQSLRCYAPADLGLLLEGTGLRLVSTEPVWTIDPADGRFRNASHLGEAASFLACFTRSTSG